MFKVELKLARGISNRGKGLCNYPSETRSVESSTNPGRYPCSPTLGYARGVVSLSYFPLSLNLHSLYRLRGRQHMVTVHHWAGFTTASLLVLSADNPIENEAPDRSMRVMWLSKQRHLRHLSIGKIAVI